MTKSTLSKTGACDRLTQGGREARRLQGYLRGHLLQYWPQNASHGRVEHLIWKVDDICNAHTRAVGQARETEDETDDMKEKYR